MERIPTQFLCGCFVKNGLEISHSNIINANNYRLAINIMCENKPLVQ